MGRDDYKHLIRLVILFGAALVVFLILRAAFMPPGFGLYGHYRAGALDDIRQQPVQYASQGVCTECHGDVAEMRVGGRHARLSCEACHGALAGHANDPGAVTPRKPNPRTLCLTCHTHNASRPARFPQIVVKDHSEEGPCTVCHQPHRPGLT